MGLPGQEYNGLISVKPTPGGIAVTQPENTLADRIIIYSTDGKELTNMALLGAKTSVTLNLPTGIYLAVLFKHNRFIISAKLAYQQY